MRRKVRMICTVGTSLISPLAKEESGTLEEMASLSDRELLERILKFKYLKHQERREAAQKLPGQLEISSCADLDWGKYLFPSAEIQTLLHWISDAISAPLEDLQELHLILLPSEALQSQLTAQGTCVYLHSLERLFPKVRLICNRKKDIAPLDIKVDNRENFITSIANLFSQFDSHLEQAKQENERVVFCTSGGYKAVAGFAMMYAQIHSLSSLYSFEGSHKAYEVMSMPLGYAYASLDEEINTLKALEQDKQLRQALSAHSSSLPRWVHDSKELAGALLKSYDAARKKPYGTGEELFNRLRSCTDGEAWADYLEDLLVQKWSNLWMGDQIAETVEHSRRHSKRLMEFAANLFRCAEPQVEKLGFTKDRPEMFAILIAAIYLHDIGHTALSCPTLQTAADAPKPDDVFPLGLFPSAVREVHQLLSGMLLRADPDRYFQRDDRKTGDSAKEQLLARCVPLVAEHHRNYTTLQGKSADPDKKIKLDGELLFGEEKFAETLRPLEKRYGENPVPEVPVKELLNLAALMRIIDGCDVQADRVVSDEYLDTRNQRSDDEAELIRLQLKSFSDKLPPKLSDSLAQLDCDPPQGDFKSLFKSLYIGVFEELKKLYEEHHRSWTEVQREALPELMALSLANRYAFKREQRNHFEKHRSVSFVLPVPDKDSKTITVKIYANKALLEKNQDGDDYLKKCKDDIEGEYESVKDVIGHALIFNAQAEGAERDG